MRADPVISYDLMYKNAEGEDACYVKELDYFYARYMHAVLVDGEKYNTPTIAKFKKDASGNRVFIGTIFPHIRIPDGANPCLLGTLEPWSDDEYAGIVFTEGEANALARGIEFGIARASAYLQFAAANTSDDNDAAVLNTYSEELMIHAPSNHVRYKVLTKALARTAELEKELLAIKNKATAAQAEYHQRLGKSPKFGIMDLPETRELLELLNGE